MSRALLIGNGSVENRGCEAILTCTAEILHSRFPEMNLVNCSARDYRVETLGHVPDTYLTHYPCPAPYTVPGIFWQFRKRVLGHQTHFQHLVGKSDLVFAIGGDNYSMDYDTAHNYLDQAEVVLNKGKPLVVWGASIGPFTSDPATESRAKDLLSQCSLISARESVTIEYLASLGITENVVRVCDPAFCLEPMEIADSQLKTFLSSGECIGINLSTMLGMFAKDREKWLSLAVDIVRATLSVFEDRNLVLVPHVMLPDNNDFHFLSAIAQKIPEAENRIMVVPDSFNAHELKWIISQMYLFIGARTHSAIAALSSGVPTITLSYSIKSIGINRDIFGHTDWLMSIKSLDLNTYRNLLKRLAEERTDVMETLRDRLPEYKQLAYAACDPLSKII